MVENISSKLHALTRNSPLQAVNFRKIFKTELFGLSLKEVSFLVLVESLLGMLNH